MPSPASSARTRHGTSGLQVGMLAVLALALSAVAAPPEVSMATGLLELQLQVGGTPRRYTAVVPDEPAGAPVVLALHYAGHGTPHYASGYVQSLVGPGLAELGAVVVAPDCPGKSWADPVSQRVALAVLDHALETWGADRSRVVLTGYSMGGMGTWALAAAHPERFVAAVPMAGHPGEHLERVKLPVYAIHGSADELIPPGPSGDAIQALVRRGVEARWVLADGVTHYDTAAFVPLLKAAVPWIRARWVLGE